MLLVHAHRNKSKKKKLKTRSKIKTYLGPDEEIKEFRIYKTLNYKITLTKDIFDESKFYKFDYIETTFNLAILFSLFEYFLTENKNNKDKEPTILKMTMKQQQYSTTSTRILSPTLQSIIKSDDPYYVEEPIR